VFCVLASTSSSGQIAPSVRALHAVGDLASLRSADRIVTGMSRSGELALLTNVADTLAGGVTHERFQQTVNGIPVWATTVTRQQVNGVVVSIFGEVYEGLGGMPTTPAISPEQARTAVAADAAIDVGDVPAQLHIRVLAVPRLVYVVRVATHGGGLALYFVDAMSGAIVEKRDDRKRQVGTGTGVFGPAKKISTVQLGAGFVAADALRPPVLNTYDLRGDWQALMLFLNGLRRLTTADFATDGDNVWTDGAAVDAHVYAGWTYDYLFKRFGRLGLDNANLPILNIVHPADRNDVTADPDLLVNAFYAGSGVMVYGDGLSLGQRLGNQSVDYLAGGLDVVAHELAHGVTDYTSQLEYQGESGALNEAFSDILGTSVEFFFQQAGTARGQADYLIGEDVFIPGGIRSMSDPIIFEQPDHYTRRYLGEEDNGGVHINSGIANHAFYLAIEGGRNATSGLTVTGVGNSNRAQIERVFYRAFTTMLPARATFSTARAATIRSAIDLFGAGSAVERAVTQAWNAVGVL
jgi:bacillolysin